MEVEGKKNVKWLMSDGKGTTARPLLAVIGPVFAFRGLVFAVIRPRSSVIIITDTQHEL